LRKLPAGESVHEAPCWALLLAAGEGRRFGGPKLLTPLGGRPLVAHVLEAIGTTRRTGTLVGGVAVVRRGDARLSEVIRGAGLRLVENDDPGAGLARSLQLGLAALEDSAAVPLQGSPGRVAGPGAVVVFLGDQPTVRADVVELLVRAWREGGGAKAVIRPRYARSPEAPGHPVLLDRSVWGIAGRLRGDVGLGSLLRDHPEWVAALDVAGENPDVNTPADLVGLERSSHA